MSPKAQSPTAAAEKAIQRVEVIDEQPGVTNIQKKFRIAGSEFRVKLIERDDEIIIALTALACHEHAFLQGKPGTGKSWLFDAIMRFVAAARWSELMMKDLPGDVVFGPVDIPNLLGKNAEARSKFIRQTFGYLPEAVVAFLDETFKAGPAVLNRVLKIANERKFTQNGVETDCPLVTMYGASNEWPDPNSGGKELTALVDRFLFRKNIEPIKTKAGRLRLLFDKDLSPNPSVTVTLAELHQAKKEAQQIPLTDKAQDTLLNILAALQKEGIVPGDRRQRKSVTVAQAYAYIEGATAVIPEHLEILQHVLCDDPVEQPKVAAPIIRKLANPHGAEIAGIMMEFQQVMDTADFSDLKTMTATHGKLKEITTKLEALKETPKQQAALDVIDRTVKDVMAQAMAKMGTPRR